MATVLEKLNGIVLLFLAVGAAAVHIPLVILILRSHSAREDIISMVMLSLSISDLLSSLTLTTLSIVSLIQPAVIPYPLAFVIGNLAQLLINVSIWHLAAMSALKCYIIVRPLTYAAVLTDRLRYVVVAGIWAATVVAVTAANAAGVRWALDPIIHIAQPVGNQTAFRYYQNFAYDGVSAVIIVVANAKILLVVRQHHLAIGALNAAAAATGSTGNGNHASWMSSVRSARSLFLMCVAYYATYVLGTPLFHAGFVPPVWYYAGVVWLVASAPVVNGLLFVFLYKSTRSDFAQMFCRRCAAVATAQSEAVPSSANALTVNPAARVDPTINDPYPY